MNAFGERVLNAAIVTVAISALATTSLAAYRTFRPAATTPPSATEQVNWETLGQTGHRMGPPNALVTIVEFSDFQCPYCKSAAATLKATVAKYPGQVAVVYRHFPLERIHRHARGAAIASECAGRQGAFERYHDVLFAQDSLKGGMFTELARRAKVGNVGAFGACLKDPSAAEAVDRDAGVAADIGIKGTPAIFVNQYRLAGGAAPHVIDSLVLVALKK